MSAPERVPVQAPCLDAPAFARIPRDDEGPVFVEPWQAHVFALTVRLSAEDRFTWTEWAAMLGAELRDAAVRGEPDDGTHYYEHWLGALEKLVAAKGLGTASALAERKHDWAAAYRATPHGQPVRLAAAREP